MSEFLGNERPASRTCLQQAPVTVLKSGDVVWIPYGWYTTVIATPSDCASAALMVQPCVSYMMAKRCPEWPSAAEYLQVFLQDKILKRRNNSARLRNTNGIRILHPLR